MSLDRYREELLGKKVSVLLEGLRGKEAYVGKLVSMDNEWTILDMSSPDAKIDRVYIRTNTILSALRYTEKFK